MKRVALWRFRVDLALHRAIRRARGEKAWTLGGDCRRCAACCEEPEVAVGPVTFRLPLARQAFLWWQRRVNGFELLRADADGPSFVFRCAHFDPATRSCYSYSSRPGMCRDYPRLLLWQANPELLPGCGYRASPPNAAGLREALGRANLTPGQRDNNYANINIVDQLQRLKGVGDVILSGGADYSMRVWLKPDQLTKLNLTVNDVVNAVKKQNAIAPGGKFGAPPSPKGVEYTYSVLLQERLVTENEFGDIIVKSDEKRLHDPPERYCPSGVGYGKLTIHSVASMAKVPAQLWCTRCPAPMHLMLPQVWRPR